MCSASPYFFASSGCSRRKIILRASSALSSLLNRSPVFESFMRSGMPPTAEQTVGFDILAPSMSTYGKLSLLEVSVFMSIKFIKLYISLTNPAKISLSETPSAFASSASDSLPAPSPAIMKRTSSKRRHTSFMALMKTSCPLT